ncbi:restriction endonuclease subunit S [Helicobacter pylori]
MNRIEKLLQTLAPKGVEFRKLGEVINILKGKQLNKELLLDYGEYPVMNGGIHASGYWNEYNIDYPKIIISQGGASAGYVNYMTSKFWAGAHCYAIELNSEKLNYKFLYYFLKNSQIILMKSQFGAGIPALNKADIETLTIPIPPLEVQQEIVKILDQFSALTTDLLAGIPAEIEARKKQYEYYQNMLLDFNDINSNHQDAKEKLAQKTYPKHLKTLLQTLAPKGVEFRKLGEVLEYDQPNKYCVTSKEFDKSYPTPVLTAGKTFILGYTNEKDNIYQASKSSPVIIFDDFTTATQWVDFPFKVKSSAMKILLPKNPTINIRFIFFYMQTIPYNISGEHTRQWISRYSQITIPIPPLEVQQEIVKILDQFSALTTDLLAGIPAEIEARKKQYEYYREKLLAFKPLTPHKEIKKC